MHAETWRQPLVDFRPPDYAADAYQKVQSAFALTDAEILFGRGKLVCAARLAIFWILRKRGLSRSECARALRRRDFGISNAKLPATVDRYVRDETTRAAFVAATEAP